MDILLDFNKKLNSETEEGAELRKAIEENDDFREFVKALSKPWGQYTFPVIIYATCDVEKTSDGYNNYTNYLPDKRRKNYEFRLFQINNVQTLQSKVLDNLLPKTFDSPEEYEGPINDAEEGLDIKFSHSSGRPKQYVFNECDNRSPLPEAVLEKLEIAGNTCNLIERELTSSAKSPSEMMNILRSSEYSEWFKKFGFID